MLFKAEVQFRDVYVSDSGVIFNALTNISNK